MHNELPKRKPTRWSEIDYSTAGLYFITICTQERQCILSEVVGDTPLSHADHPVGGGALDAPHVILTDIGKIVEKHLLGCNKMPPIYIDKYIIMPNHIHIIVGISRGVEAPPPTSVHRGSRGVEAPPPTSVRSPANALIPRFVSTFKRFCNAEIGKNIFQRSFYDHVIRNGREYEEIAAYIAKNPQTWREDSLYT